MLLTDSLKEKKCCSPVAHAIYNVCTHMLLYPYMRTVHVEVKGRLMALQGTSTLETASEGS